MENLCCIITPPTPGITNQPGSPNIAERDCAGSAAIWSKPRVTWVSANAELMHSDSVLLTAEYETAACASIGKKGGNCVIIKFENVNLKSPP